MDQTDVVIVGAGVVGLAVAVEMSCRYPDREILLVEKYGRFGQETSSRNSEVIHGGMYYPTGSLKAKLCVAGNRLLYQFCAAHQVPHKQLGKIIITRNSDEEAAVKKIYEQGQANGVPGLRYLDAAEVHQLEPHIEATGGLFSETTGIIDSHQLMARLEGLAEAQGVLLCYAHEVLQVKKSDHGYVIHYRNPDGEGELETKVLFNCAGLYSDSIPEQLGIDVDAAGYRIYPCKGEYFSLAPGKARLIQHLVYPPPAQNLKGLGIHMTKSLDGMGKMGPSAEYVDSKTDYNVDPSHLEQFYEAAHSYLPFVEREDLNPDMAGIRPKTMKPGGKWTDFVITNEAKRGLPNLIDLVGIESPGLTASLAIAKYAVDQVEKF